MIRDGLIVFVVATIPLVFGAVQPVVWSAYAGVMISVFLWEWLKNSVDFGFLKSPWFFLTAGAFLAFTVVQVVPVPEGFLAAISPVRHGVLEKTAMLLGKEPGWEAMSYVWRDALSWWVFLAAVVLFARVFWAYAGQSRNLMIIAGVMMAVGLFEALYGLVQALIPTLGVLWADVESGLGNARGTYINRNHFAGFIEMVWPVGLGLVLGLAHLWGEDRFFGHGHKRRLKNFLASDRVGLQLFFWAALVFILLGLLFSKSRAGITGAFIGFVAFVMLAHVGGRRFSWPAWVAMGAGFAFLLFYGNVIGFEELVGRFMIIDESAGSRLDEWKDTWVMIKDHPLGVGLRNFDEVMPVYNVTVPLGIKNTHAHNDYLQILAEAGWPGFVFVVGGFFVFLGACVRRIWKYGSEMDAVRLYIGIGAISGLISIAFHSLFDFNLQIPGNLVYFGMLVVIGGRGVQGSRFNVQSSKFKVQDAE